MILEKEDQEVVLASDWFGGRNSWMKSLKMWYANADKTAINAQNKWLLEINPSHPIVKELLDRVKDNPNDETEEYAQMLNEAALINSGYLIIQNNH